MHLFATLINLGSITLFFLSSFLEIHEQLLLKAIKKLEALSEAIREYCNIVSVSRRTLFRQYLFLCRPDSTIMLIKS